MPKRRFADLLSDLLKFGAIIYFLIEVALLLIGVTARQSINIGGIVGIILNMVILYSLGVLLDVLLNIERALYELLAVLKRPRN